MVEDLSRYHFLRGGGELIIIESGLTLFRRILTGKPSECQTVGSKLFAKVISRGKETLRTFNMVECLTRDRGAACSPPSQRCVLEQEH